MRRDRPVSRINARQCRRQGSERFRVIEQDAEILREAGFRDVELFYAALTWRGWIGYA
jgi:tRNA (cmo5U34)-methyltransferase